MSNNAAFAELKALLVATVRELPYFPLGQLPPPQHRYGVHADVTGIYQRRKPVRRKKGRR